MSMRPVNRFLAIAALVVVSASATAPLAAAELSNCLNKQQQAAVLASGKVVTLSHAIAAARARKGDVVRASLCQRSGGLVYVLTLLRRDGKVMRMTVDAQSGRLAGGR